MIATLKQRDKREAELDSMTNRIQIAEFTIAQERIALKEGKELYEQWKKDHGVNGIKY